MTRTVLITGAGSGAGAVIARRLAEDGFAVVIADINADGAAAVAAEIVAAGGEATSRVMDVSDSESVRDSFAAVAEAHELYGLVNNAGVVSIGPVEDLSDADWRRIIDVNLTGTFYCSRAIVPHLKASGRGRIVNISSQSGKKGEPLLAHYAAAKFGVIGFTQALALEVARYGTTVNAICPTIMDTRMMRTIAEGQAQYNGRSVDAELADMSHSVPVGRPANPADIAATVSFLFRDEAEFITGEAVNVTGGNWMA